AVDLALLDAYLELKDWTKAQPIAERLARQYPDSGGAFVSWMQVLTQLGKTDEAEALAKDRLEHRPKNVDAMRSYVRIETKRGRYDEAAKWARRLVDDVTPTNVDYNEAAWVALFTGKDFD